MARSIRKRGLSRRLSLEHLEARSLLATITVTTTSDVIADDGAVSLREAIISANNNLSVNDDVVPVGAFGADTIIVPAGTYTLTIPGQNEDAAAEGDLDIRDDLSIVGAGAAATIIQAGPDEASAIDRVLHIVEDFEVRPTVSLSGATIRHGVVSATDVGGGILSQHNLTLTDSVVAHNRAGRGGGIYHSAEGTLTLVRSSVSLNFADKGGGILNSAGIVGITESTIDLNTGSTQGGGLLNTGSSMSLVRSTVSGNHAGHGGGGAIFNRAPLTMTNTTVANNSANGNGGGISNTGASATLSLLNVTIVYNFADAELPPDGVGDGGGLYTESPTDLQNSIVGHNSDRGGGEAPDIAGAVNSLGYNLIESTAGTTIAGDTTGNIIGLDPLLEQLADNGGHTQTTAPLPGSPAIDAADPASFPPTDQRGVPRPQGASADIGAFEVEPTGLHVCEIATFNLPGSAGSAALIDDADNPGRSVLLVTGTSQGDVVIVEPRPSHRSQIRVKINGQTVAIFNSTAVDRIVAFGLRGNDTIIINPTLRVPATLFGNEGRDHLFAARATDELDGGDGGDYLFGGSEDDTLCGGSGNDFLYGQAGNDLLWGDAGDDKLFGEAGGDHLQGGEGNDFLSGGIGNDRLFGQAGNDQLFGDSGNDISVGGDGDDRLFGSAGRDLLLGGLGADLLFGEAQDDVLVAGTTVYDEDEDALLAILAEWVSTNSYLARVNNLRLGGGANGVFVFDSGTLGDDGASDTLWGNGNLDWFLYGPGDKLQDRALGELLN